MDGRDAADVTWNKRGGELGVEKDGKRKLAKISLAGADFIATLTRRRAKRYLHIRGRIV